jgi:hypothetical protein
MVFYFVVDICTHMQSTRVLTYYSLSSLRAFECTLAQELHKIAPPVIFSPTSATTTGDNGGTQQTPRPPEMLFFNGLFGEADAIALARTTSRSSSNSNAHNNVAQVTATVRQDVAAAVAGSYRSIGAVDRDVDDDHTNLSRFDSASNGQAPAHATAAAAGWERMADRYVAACLSSSAAPEARERLALLQELERRNQDLQREREQEQQRQQQLDAAAAAAAKRQEEEEKRAKAKEQATTAAAAAAVAAPVPQAQDSLSRLYAHVLPPLPSIEATIALGAASAGLHSNSNSNSNNTCSASVASLAALSRHFPTLDDALRSDDGYVYDPTHGRARAEALASATAVATTTQPTQLQSQAAVAPANTNNSNSVGTGTTIVARPPAVPAGVSASLLGPHTPYGQPSAAPGQAVGTCIFMCMPSLLSTYCMHIHQLQADRQP